MKPTLMETLRSIRKNPYKLFSGLTHHGFFTRMEDEMYLRLLYRGVLGKKLHLDPPLTYSEKIQWLKLYDKNPLYPVLCDKLAVRDYVKKQIGEQYLIPMLGVWDDPDAIDFSSLPNRFVLKCTHDSGSVVLCPDKADLDVQAARKKLRKKLNRDYSVPGREWPYRDVPRKIIAEEYLCDEAGHPAIDYKFFCFDGRVQLVLVCMNHETRHAGNYTYLRDFTYFPIYQMGENDADEQIVPRPLHYGEMLELAETLSAGFKHMRVDLYSTPQGVCFGEITLHSSSGMSQTMLEAGDRYLGDQLHLDL